MNESYSRLANSIFAPRYKGQLEEIRLHFNNLHFEQNKPVDITWPLVIAAAVCGALAALGWIWVIYGR